MNKKKYWWKDDPEIGTYDFCCREDGRFCFYIDDVAVRYNNRCGWTEEERQRRFKGAKFVLNGCADGESYSQLLKAETVEEAKKEFELWFEQYLVGKIERLSWALAFMKEELELFLAYKRG